MRLIKNLIVAQSAFLILLILAWPLFHAGFFRVHDYTHVARIVEMVDALRAGHFPVLWSADFGFGYGMPLFLFYGPVPFYLASLPTLLGLAPLVSLKLLIFFTHFIAWLGMYNLMKRWGRTVGFVAATAFALAPYRALDLYVRGAINELFALSLLPWILHFAWMIPDNRRRGWLGLSLTTAVLIASHNLTALMALPVIGILSLVWLFWHHHSWKRDSVILILGFGSGLLLSAFYAVPAFLEKDSTIINEITGGYFDYHLHFLYIRQFFQVDWGFGGSTLGPDDDISFHLGYGTLFLAGLAALGTLWDFIHDWRTKRRFRNLLRYRPTQVLIVITGLLLGGSLLLTTFKTQWLWDSLPLLAFIQFPWRFLAVANFLLAMLAGWGIGQIRPAPWRWFFAWLITIVVVASQIQFHHPQQYLDRVEDFYYTDRQLIRTNMSSILPDYLPQTFDRKLEPVDPANRIVVSSEPTLSPRWELNRPHELLLFTSSAQPGKVTWNIADFPGWQYYVNDQRVEPELLPDGRRQYTSDEPITTVGALFALTPLRQTAQLTSLAMLIIWLAVALPPLSRPSRQEAHVRA